MKKLLLLVMLLKGTMVIFAQNETTVNLKIEQPDPLFIEVTGIPEFSGDNSVLTITGGTPEYVINWESESDDIYIVTVTDARNCSALISINSTSIAAGEIESVIKVYPNPVEDVLTVSLPYEENVHITLLSIDGNILMEEKIVKTSEAFNLSMEKYNAGIYILKITTLTKSYTQSIVKK